jgi:aminopeptidase
VYREQSALEYAKLVARVGVNVQEGQTVVLSAYVECAEMARLIAEQCYLAGAGQVIVQYADEEILRLRYLHASEEALTDIPDWKYAPIIESGRKGACFINLISENPDAFAGLDTKRIGISSKAESAKRAPFYEILDKSENQWTVVAAPSAKWAGKVYPDLSEQAAVNRLWDDIFHTVRVDTGDAVLSWEQHSAELRTHCDKLNGSRIKSLRFKNSLGTDLAVTLADNYIWAGGAEYTVGGVCFQANMPSEEIFTMPHREKVSGVVYASMPLIHNGMKIDKFWMRFEDGAVTDYDALCGKDALEQIFKIDEGAKHLGEVALVPYNSMIRETGTLFYNTLFDENASCHLALGSAYPINMAGGAELTSAQKAAAGCNESNTHVDFMFGTSDLSVVGVTDDGEEIVIFENGDWAE